MTRASVPSTSTLRPRPVPARQPRRPGDRSRIGPIGSALLLILSLLLVAPTFAHAQSGPPDRGADDQCRTEYQQAEDLYLGADFDPAIRLLQTCLDETQAVLADTTKVQIYRLLAFSHLGLGDDESARQAVTSLLTVEPNYQPDPTRDRPDFVQLVQQAREERRSSAVREEKDRSWVKWVVGGVSVVALGVLAAVIGGGGGDGDIDDD